MLQFSNLPSLSRKDLLWENHKKMRVQFGRFVHLVGCQVHVAAQVYVEMTSSMSVWYIYGKVYVQKRQMIAGKASGSCLICTMMYGRTHNLVWQLSTHYWHILGKLFLCPQSTQIIC